MNDNYTKWVEREKNWINEKEKKLKKDTLIYSPLVIVILAILCGGIGIWVGKDMAGVLQNALMGACMGIVGIPNFFFLMQFSFPAKRYMGNLKEQIEDVLSPAEREEFAFLLYQTSEMQIYLKEKQRRKCGLRRTMHCRQHQMEQFPWYNFKKVEKIVMNVREYTAKTRGEGLKILQTSTVYPMYFYYRKSEKEKTKEYDRELSFGKREDRKLVAYYLHEMKIGNED